MMAANVAPSIASSTAVDESGNPLVGEKKTRNDTLKRLRLQKSQLETAYSSAQNAFDTAVMNFKREGMNKQNSYSVIIQSKINSIEIPKEESEEKTKAQQLMSSYTDISQQITECWNNFQNSAKDTVMAVASSEEETPVTSIFILNGVDKEAELIKFTTVDDTNGLKVLEENYNKAVNAYKTVLNIKKQLDDVDIKYNETIYGVSVIEENKA